MVHKMAEWIVHTKIFVQWMDKDWKLRDRLWRLYPETERKGQVENFRIGQVENALKTVIATLFISVLAGVNRAGDSFKSGLAIFGKVAVFGILVTALLFYLPESRLEQREKERKQKLLLAYPELVNQFILLLGAGLTMKAALGKILGKEEQRRQEQKNREEEYLYWELRKTYTAMENGMTEAAAFEEMGNRVKLLPYMRFAALLSQNLRKGSAELLLLLELEAADAFAQRKEHAKRLGEEASTKMLFPMIMMLGIVMALVVIPAFMQI